MGNKKNRSEKSSFQFFWKDESGKDVFYPWGYPGEGFYVDEIEKIKIIRFLFIFSISFILFAVIQNVAVYYGFLSLYGKAWSYAVAWALFPFIYIYRMYDFSIKFDPYISIKRRTPKITYILLVLLLIQLATMVAGLNAYSVVPSVIFLLLINGLYLLILSFLFILSFQNKGYFLQNFFSKHA